MHINTLGQGPDMVMLHGWSMHSAVWHDLAKRLAKKFTLHLVDLPGHGQSNWHTGALNLDDMTANLVAQLPENAHWIGWSLGGLISLAFANRFPERVKKLMLIAATPCFVKNAEWQCAMEAAVFNAFADNLNDNQTATLQRFLFLQARGSEHSRDTIRQLSHQIAVEKPPHPDALRDGLALLINTDLREQLTQLTCPVQMILGDRDTLIPTEMLACAQQLKSDIKTELLAGAGHAPFISQAAECQQAIETFINE